jgi:hypothetical protein
MAQGVCSLDNNLHSSAFLFLHFAIMYVVISVYSQPAWLQLGLTEVQDKGEQVRTSHFKNLQTRFRTAFLYNGEIKFASKRNI